MAPLFLLALCLALGGAAAHMPKGLQTLTFDTWSSTTVTGSPPSVVAFTHPTEQGASYGVLHDIMVKLADDVKNVRFIEVDCSTQAPLCRNFQVRRYPYLAYFTEDTNTSGVESARPYLGRRTNEGLRQFVKKITTPAINEIESAPTLDVMVDEITAGGERVVYLMVQPPQPPIKPNTTRIEGPKEPLVEAFRLTAFRLRDRYGFANLRANGIKDVGGLAERLPPLPEGLVNATYVVRLGLGDRVTAPRLLGFTGARAVPYTFRAMAALGRERRAWGGGGGAGGGIPDPAKDPVQAGLLAWALRWRQPLVTLLPRNLTELASNPEGRVVVVAVLAGEGSEEAARASSAPFLARVQALAELATLDPAPSPPGEEGEEEEPDFVDRVLFAKYKLAGKGGGGEGLQDDFLAQYGLTGGQGFGSSTLSALPTLVAYELLPGGGKRVTWAAQEEVKDEQGMEQWLNKISGVAGEAEVKAAKVSSTGEVSE